MKAIVSVCLIAAALAAHGDKFVFSADGRAVAASATRRCPAQAVRLSDKKLVVGLPVLSDIERAACGYYRCVTNTPPVAYSNEIYTISAYTPQADGTALSAYKKGYLRPVVKRYSKYAISRALISRGVYTAFKQAVEAAGYWDLWLVANNLSSDDDIFGAFKAQIGAACGMTAAEVDTLLEDCEWHE